MKIDNFKERFSNFAHEFYKNAQRIGFWILIILMVGFLSGVYTSRFYMSYRIEEAIQLEGFVYKSSVYTIKEDPLRAKKKI